MAAENSAQFAKLRGAIRKKLQSINHIKEKEEAHLIYTLKGGEIRSWSLKKKLQPNTSFMEN